MTYLDHAGATLYSESQLEAHVSNLTTNLYGNPHSQSPSSQTCTAAVDHARDSILQFFGTDSSHYDVVFTSGCTGALKLLAECFPWQRPLDLNPLPSTVDQRTDMKEGLSNPSHMHPEKTNMSISREQSSPGTLSLEEVVRVENENENGSQVPVSKAGGSVPKEGSQTVMKETVKVFYTQDLKRMVGERENIDIGLQPRRSSSREDERGGREGGSVFCYLEDNHTSVVGMREVAGQFGATVVCATEQDLVGWTESENGTSWCESGTARAELRAAQCESGTSNTRQDLAVHSGSSNNIISPLSSENAGPFNLFVYPAQSNFCGRKYPLTWCTRIPTGLSSITRAITSLSPSLTQPTTASWKICLDAASFVGTNPLNLTEFPADFVALSFYKIFGFPTGLGALLVHRDSSTLLQKRYYGGGTVLATVSRTGLHLSRSELHERSVKFSPQFLL